MSISTRIDALTRYSSLTMPALYDRRLTEELTRYMRFGQLVDVLSNGLFIPSVSLFDDPWEGHVFHSITSEERRREALARMVNSSKRWIYALCWHAAEHESYAMWKVYGRYDAVALHITPATAHNFVRTISAKTGARPVLMMPIDYALPKAGKLQTLEPSTIYSVSYEDPDNEDRVLWRNVMQQCFGTKAAGYEFEKEVRMLALDPEAPTFWEQMITYTPRPGLRVPIDPSQFIARITVSPDAPQWFVQAVTAVADKFGLPTDRVKKSVMHDAPQGRL